MVDFILAYECERDEGRKRESRRGEENGTGSYIAAKRAHDGRGRPVQEFRNEHEWKRRVQRQDPGSRLQPRS